MESTIGRPSGARSLSADCTIGHISAPLIMSTLRRPCCASHQLGGAICPLLLSILFHDSYLSARGELPRICLQRRLRAAKIAAL